MKIPSTAAGLVCLAVALACAPPAQAYEEGSVDNGGTIEGKLTYQGRVPMRTIIPTKDEDVCGGMREVPKIRLSDDGGVQDAVVYLAGIEKGKSWSADADQAETPAIDNVECRFEPHVQVIRPGNMDVVNSDPVLHNTHGFYGRRTAFNLALPNKGQTIEVDLDRPGLVRVECDAHGWMLGWVFVANNPYYAITGEDGTFTIENVPPGEYTMGVWQEHTGMMEKSVTVKGGETTSVSVELKK